MGYSKDPSTYSPEFYALIQEASRRELVMDFPDEKTAIAFQHKLNSFRSALVRKNHPLGIMASKMVFSRRENKVLVREDPALSAFKRTGVSYIPEPSDTLLNMVTESTNEEKSQ